MSAFQVSPRHLSAIVTAWIDLGIYATEWRSECGPMRVTDCDNWQRAYDDLARANAVSVGARYREETEPVPGPFRIEKVPTMQAIKAIDCLVYQSCEALTWEGSRVERALRELRTALTRKLPGYEDAEWSL